MKANKMLKGIAVIGTGYLIANIFFEAGKGWVLDTIKTAAKCISAEETVKIFNQLPDQKSSKTMAFASKLAEEDTIKRVSKIES